MSRHLPGSLARRLHGRTRRLANSASPLQRGPAIRSAGHSHRGRRSWKLEALEDRTLLSTWTVNSLGDSGTGTGHSGDLRYCITQADATTGDNTIEFSVTGTITLNSALPDLSNTTGLTDIEGPGAASLTVARSGASGTPDFSVFVIEGGVNVKLVGLTIADGLVIGNGGGIFNDGTLTVTDCNIENNSAAGNSTPPGVGGGIYNLGTMTVTNSGITDNSAAVDAGAIFNQGSLTVTNSTFANNSSADSGAVQNAGTMTVTNSTFADNAAANGRGGGIDNETGGALTVTNSTFADNAAVEGGGIGNVGALALTNSTIDHNFASNDGGGIASFSTSTVTNSTITDNSAAQGGGIFTVNGVVTLDNTIVALNTNTFSNGADDVNGSVDSASAYNLIGTGGSGGLVNGVDGNQVDVADPGLSPLGEFGGPTPTIAVLPGSPAIGKGSDSIPGVTVPTTDQRGVVRPPSSIDIGAFQDRGFKLALVAGSSPQATTVNTQFPNPLAVTITSPFGDPVAGGVISFTVAPAKGGASATLSAGAVTIAADGQAGATATANGTRGAYAVTASAAGVKVPAQIRLRNVPASPGAGESTPAAAIPTTALGLGLPTADPGTEPTWPGPSLVRVTVDRATPPSAGGFTVHGSIGTGVAPVTVPWRIATGGRSSSSDGRTNRTPAARPAPRAEVRLAGRGRGWSLGISTKLGSLDPPRPAGH
jgi:hypothetical protein